MHFCILTCGTVSILLLLEAVWFNQERSMVGYSSEHKPVNEEFYKHKMHFKGNWHLIRNYKMIQMTHSMVKRSLTCVQKFSYYHAIWSWKPVETSKGVEHVYCAWHKWDKNYCWIFNNNKNGEEIPAHTDKIYTDIFLRIFFKF